MWCRESRVRAHARASTVHLLSRSGAQVPYSYTTRYLSSNLPSYNTVLYSTVCPTALEGFTPTGTQQEK